VESWMKELSDDPEIVEVIWEILGAIVRPHVRWNKSAWFYSEQGNNGKGTLCQLMRNLTGPASYASIPINDFGKEFLLEPLTRASAIIVDENDVGTFIDKAANLKAIITNDVISINRKHKTPIAFQFWGFMVQCLNEFPRIKDKSESFYRRQLFVPFLKTFTGRERTYIKDDYLHRDDVLEYVLWRVLHMDYYELSEPEATKLVLAEYKQFNDPVRAFFEEFEDQFVWDLLPFAFLYDLYRVWFTQTSPSGSPVGRNIFIKDIVAIVRQSKTWFCKDKNLNIRPSNKLSIPEPLVTDHDLKDWMNKSYPGSSVAQKALPYPLKGTYRGLLRTLPSSGMGDDDSDPDDTGAGAFVDTSASPFTASDAAPADADPADELASTT
jgi:putative DNA primase/helicase